MATFILCSPSFLAQNQIADGQSFRKENTIILYLNLKIVNNIKHFKNSNPAFLY